MTVETVPSVAVIGAGAAGLAAGRILREEGLTVTIFEKSRHVGGVWRYKPRDELAPMCESTKPFAYNGIAAQSVHCMRFAVRSWSLYALPRDTYQ